MAGDDTCGEAYYAQAHADFKAMGCDGAALQVLREGLSAHPSSALLAQLAAQEGVDVAPSSAVKPAEVRPAVHCGEQDQASATLAPAAKASWRPPPSACLSGTRDAGIPTVRALREAQAAQADFVEADAASWASRRTGAFLDEEKRLRDDACKAFVACRDELRRFGLEFRPELTRPPCTPDVLSRTQEVCSRVGPEEALRDVATECNAAAYQDLQAFDAEGPGAYLRLARQLSETDAPVQRARDLATTGHATAHALLTAVAQEAAAAVRAAPPGTARVLVLGGHGASAVAAARAGAAHVVVCETRRYVANAAREVLRRNLSKEEVARCVIEEARSPSNEDAWDVIAIDLWESVNALSLGALDALRAVHVKAGGAPRVVPARIVAEVSLADGRLSSVSGFDLSRMDARFRGLSAQPLRVGPSPSENGGGPPPHPTALRPEPLTETIQAFDVRLGDALAGARSASGEVVTGGCTTTTEPLQFRGLRSGVASMAVVTVSFQLQDCDGEKATTEQLCFAQVLPGGCRVEEAGEVPGICAILGPGRIWLDWDWAASVEPPFGYMALSEWYFEMLRDSARHSLYERALRAEIAAVRARKGSAGAGGVCRVLDVGSGDGILSMMALRNGAAAAVGVEVVTAIARTSEEVVASNRPSGHPAHPPEAPLSEAAAAPLDIWCSDVRGITSPPEDLKFDVLVSELMDASGLGENLIFLTEGARRRLCVPDAPVIPARLRLVAVLCEARLPQLAGVNMDAFWPFWPLDRTGPNPTLWVGVDLDKGEGDFRILTEPAELLSLELGVADSVPPRKDVDFRGVAEGIANVVVWWFETQLSTADPSAVLTNAPKRVDSRHAATCWGQAMANLPADLPVAAGASAEITMEIPFGDYQLKFKPRGPAATIRDVAEEVPPPGTPAYSAAFVEDLGAYREAQKQAKQLSRNAGIARSAVRNADLAALGALRQCATCICAQPFLFGVEPTTALRLCMGWYAVGGEGRS